MELKKTPLDLSQRLRGIAHEHVLEAYELRLGAMAPELHVVTDIIYRSESPGYDAKAHEELMVLVRLLRGWRREDYGCFVIHSPDQP
ncbi:MAG: hypothetical protein AB1508_04990 [Pseudomonadota bacterium]